MIENDRKYAKQLRANTKFEGKGEETNEKRTSRTKEAEKAVIFDE